MPSDSVNTTSRMTPTSEDDARLYSLVHDALAQNEAESSERREGRRGVFSCVQLVAPYDGGELPQQADFFHVECCDLSTSGFSFVVPTAPKTDRLVVALGRVPFQFFIAEIVNRRPVVSAEEGVFRIGCQFRQRIER